MPTTLRIDVNATIHGFHTISPSQGSAYPSIPVLQPTAPVLGVFALSGVHVAQKDLDSHGDYEEFVRGLVQSRLGAEWGVELFETESRPNSLPPPFWKYDGKAVALHLLRRNEVYIEEQVGRSAIVDVGFCLTAYPD